MTDRRERLERIAIRAIQAIIDDPEYQDGDRAQVCLMTGTAEEGRAGAITAAGYDESNEGTRAAMLDLIYQVQYLGTTAGVGVNLVQMGAN